MPNSQPKQETIEKSPRVGLQEFLNRAAQSKDIAERMGKARVLGERAKKLIKEVDELTEDLQKSDTEFGEHLGQTVDAIHMIPYILGELTDGRPTPFGLPKHIPHLFHIKDVTMRNREIRDYEKWASCETGYAPAATYAGNGAAVVAKQSLDFDEVVGLRNWLNSVIEWHEVMAVRNSQEEKTIS